jgi:hypothetical protein
MTTETTKGHVDIVFVIDRSESMLPCINAVKESITKLIDVFKNDTRLEWDVRLDFLAHSSGNNIFRMESVNLCNMDILNSLYRRKPSPEQSFFTGDVEKFKRRLSEIKVAGDETTLVALDIALDYPWRQAINTHRAVILLTDEGIETGEDVEWQEAQIKNFYHKITEKCINLFMATPESDIFEKLAMTDRSIHKVVRETRDGMANVNFDKLLNVFGNSLSKSIKADGANDRLGPLYNQDKWKASKENIDIGPDKR